MLDREFEFYVNNQTELVKKYNGRFLVIHNKEVFGDYATLREAYRAGTKNYQLGTFMVHKCGPGKENFSLLTEKLGSDLFDYTEWQRKHYENFSVAELNKSAVEYASTRGSNA